MNNSPVSKPSRNGEGNKMTSDSTCEDNQNRRYAEGPEIVSKRSVDVCSESPLNNRVIVEGLQAFKEDRK